MKLPRLPDEYSASLVRSDGDSSRLFLRSDRRRIEMDFANGHRHIVIAQGDLGIGWLWQNADPWLETKMDWQSIAGSFDPSDAMFWRNAGREEVDGEPCVHYLGFPNEADATVLEECFVDASGIRRRTVTYRKDGSIGIAIDCNSIKLGPPPLELFEPAIGSYVQRVGGRKNQPLLWTGPRRV